jgi:hypothetical protein
VRLLKGLGRLLKGLERLLKGLGRPLEGLGRLLKGLGRLLEGLGDPDPEESRATPGGSWASPRRVCAGSCKQIQNLEMHVLYVNCKNVTCFLKIFYLHLSIYSIQYSHSAKVGVLRDSHNLFLTLYRNFE